MSALGGRGRKEERGRTGATSHRHDMSGLIVEKDEAMDFEAWSIDSLSTLSEEDKKKFLSFIFLDDSLTLFKKAQRIIESRLKLR